MDRFHKWLMKNDYKSKYIAIFWNALGGALFAGQMAFILIFISRKNNLETAGIVTIAYAVGNLFQAIGKYGVKNYQITDSGSNNSFYDYYTSRKISTMFAALCGMVYLVICSFMGDYSLYKVIIIAEIIILKLVDSMEDVYLGRYQQQGAFIVGAKIMAVRQLIVTVLICLLVFLNIDVISSLTIANIASILILYVLVRMTIICGNVEEEKKYNRENVVAILKQCFPLCVGTTLAIYVGNAPKYMIDIYLDERTQAIFGYIMLPVFVVTLLNQFIYQPFVKELGDLWLAKKTKAFCKKIVRQCLLVAIMAIAVLIVCLVIGLPFLSLLYNVDLTIYSKEFVVLLLGGSLYALAFYLTIPITTIRMQKSIAAGNIIVAILALVLQKKFVLGHGILGAAWLYVIMNGVLLLIYGIVLVVNLKKTNNYRNESNESNLTCQNYD